MVDSIDLGARIEEGIRLLTYRQTDEARSVFLEVWRIALGSGDHYYACAAAHMLGVMEPMPLEEKLGWHLESLDQANRVRDGRVGGWYPSIHINLGLVYRLLNKPAEALSCYERAMLHTDALEDASYAEALRSSIEKAVTGLKGVEGTETR